MENSGWQAVADLGTNTFQLLVARMTKGKVEIGLRLKTGVQIGKNGMLNRNITDEALQRAKAALLDFDVELKAFGLLASDCKTLATSAFRNSENRLAVVDFLKSETGFSIEIIDGITEAQLIFSGVAASGALDQQSHSLIMDIGGGSVEFILCQGLQNIWAQSFEVGGLRLMERFHQTDPISQQSQWGLKQFLLNQLQPVWEQISKHRPKNLVGCSGSFDTLVDMQFHHLQSEQVNSEDNACPILRISDFEALAQILIQANLSERLAMKGMIPLRAEMMVVAVLMIQLLIEKMNPTEIRVSTYSLKEGWFWSNFATNDSKFG